MKRWQIIVPVKGTTHAKSRLGEAAGPHRPRLALAFAQDTVAAAMNCPLVADATVVTGDTTAASAFEQTGVHLFDDGAADGLNAAISVAIREDSRLRDAERVAVLLGDLPALTSAALQHALAVAESHEFSFVPDDKDLGTTLLCARGAAALRPLFGVESAAAHEAAGAIRLSDSQFTTLRHDVDDLDDLLIALRIGVGEHTDNLLRAIRWSEARLVQLANAASEQPLATTSGPNHP